MTTARGIGSFTRSLNGNQQPRPLRRPGDDSLKKFNSFAKSIEDSDNIGDITAKLNLLSTSSPKEVDYSHIVDTVKTVSQTGKDLEKCTDIIFNFGLKNKWNAHVSALLCIKLADVIVEGVNFKHVLLKKLQTNYCDRNLKFPRMDAFISDVLLLCEVFHHLRCPDGSGYKVLATPVFDYLGMLIDGGSEKEVEVVREQIVKCYTNLKQCDPSGIDKVLGKLRKKIVSDSVEVSVRASLLEIFELMLNNGSPFSENSKTFYDLLTKPVIKICD